MSTSAPASGAAPSNSARVNWRLIFAIAGCSLAARVLADVVVDPVPSGDEAIVGLMARHILLQGERPVFYYGQDYLGSLEAYLAAACFALFGESTAALRLTPLLFWSGYVVLMGWLASQMIGARLAPIAALLATIASPVVLYHARQAFGGSGAEMLCLGTAQLALAVAIARKEQPKGRRRWLLPSAFGLVVGLSLWVHFLSAVYTLAAALYVLAARGRRLGQELPGYLAAALAVAIGFAPALIWNATNGWRSFTFLAFIVGGSGSAQEGEPTLTLERLSRIAGEGLVAAVGARNDWDTWLALPWHESVPFLSGAVLLLYVAFFLVWVATRLRSPALAGVQAFDLVVLVAALNLAFFLPLRFGPEGPIVRYLLPLSGVAPLAAAWFLGRLLTYRRALYAGALALLLVHNGYFSGMLLTSGTLYPIAALRGWLEAARLTRVYSSYWIAYPLVFASQERIIASPAQPLLSLGTYPDSERYPPYTRLVREASDPVFVFDRQKAEGQLFARRLADEGITYRLDVVAERFLVFRCFSDDLPGA